jgi:hypothetical protein
MARNTKPVLVDPVALAAALNEAPSVIEALEGLGINEVPTFVHSYTPKGGVERRWEDVRIVKCSGVSNVWSPVAKIEDGVYVTDNTFFGNDKTAKDGLYRIDKAVDAEQQKAWRAKQAAEIAEATEVEDADEAPEVEESPAPAPRKRAPRKQAS